jgi:hypothetical protein
MVRITAFENLLVNATTPPGQACAAQIEFNDASGNPLRNPAVISLQPDTSVSIPALDASSKNARYLSIDAVALVSSVPTTPGALSPSLCITDVEIVDSLTNSPRALIPPSPPMDPMAPQQTGKRIYSPITLAFGQGLRLNAIAPLQPPNPCFAILSFLDSNGKQVGPSKPISLAPGHGDALELNSIGLVAPLRPILIQAIIALAPSTVPPLCIPTVEVFDSFTLADLIVQTPLPASAQ